MDETYKVKSLTKEPGDWTKEGCPICGGFVIYTNNKAIYGKQYGNGKCYLCTECNAHVGVHGVDHPTRRPLGILATHEMSQLKMACHKYFDRAWRSKSIGRQTAYKRLAKQMGIAKKRCHFGWFNEDDLRKALTIVSKPKWWEVPNVRDRI